MTPLGKALLSQLSCVWTARDIERTIVEGRPFKEVAVRLLINCLISVYHYRCTIPRLSVALTTATWAMTEGESIWRWQCGTKHQRRLCEWGSAAIAEQKCEKKTGTLLLFPWPCWSENCWDVLLQGVSWHEEKLCPLFWLKTELLPHSYNVRVVTQLQMTSIKW